MVRYELLLSLLLCWMAQPTFANPDAKRLYDDLLSNYNRYICRIFIAQFGFNFLSLYDFCTIFFKQKYVSIEFVSKKVR